MQIPLSPSAPRVTKAEVGWVLDNDPAIEEGSVRVWSVIEYMAKATVFDVQYREAKGDWVSERQAWQRRMDGSVTKVGLRAV